MKVFLDTNVLVSDFMWGGVCEEVVEVVFAGHDPITGEAVLDEFKGVLTDKFDVPAETSQDYTSIFRHHHVEPRADEPYEIPIDDPKDPWILAAAVDAGADILVTGDKPFQSADSHVDELRICSPREFLEMIGEQEG